MYTVERIDPSKTALIVVDMQNDFVAPGAPMEAPAGRAMLPHLQRALACCREHGIPVIYTAHTFRAGGCDLGLLAHVPPIARGDALVDGTPGVAIYPAVAPRDGEHRDHQAPVQRLLRHGPGDRPARARGDHGRDRRRHHRELLPRHRPRRVLPRLPGRLPRRRHREHRLSRSRLRQPCRPTRSIGPRWSFWRGTRRTSSRPRPSSPGSRRRQTASSAWRRTPRTASRTRRAKWRAYHKPPLADGAARRSASAAAPSAAGDRPQLRPAGRGEHNEQAPRSEAHEEALGSLVGVLPTPLDDPEGFCNTLEPAPTRMAMRSFERRIT